MADLDEKPLIVQSDKTLLLEVDHPMFESARSEISKFAELEKSPEYLHTYRITPLSLWNAAASKLKAEQIVDTLYRFSKYPVPQAVSADIYTQIGRYGKLKLDRDDRGDLVLKSTDPRYIAEVIRNKKVQPYVEGPKNPNEVYVKADFRGHIKQALIKIGFPVEDVAGYEKGNDFKFDLRARGHSSRTVH